MPPPILIRAESSTDRVTCSNCLRSIPTHQTHFHAQFCRSSPSDNALALSRVIHPLVDYVVPADRGRHRVRFHRRGRSPSPTGSHISEITDEETEEITYEDRRGRSVEREVTRRRHRSVSFAPDPVTTIVVPRRARTPSPVVFIREPSPAPQVVFVERARNRSRSRSRSVVRRYAIHRDPHPHVHRHRGHDHEHVVRRRRDVIDRRGNVEHESVEERFYSDGEEEDSCSSCDESDVSDRETVIEETTTETICCRTTRWKQGWTWRRRTRGGWKKSRCRCCCDHCVDTCTVTTTTKVRSRSRSRPRFRFRFT